MIDLAVARFRANPGYEAVSFNRLSSRDLDLAHVEGASSPELYGILRPRNGVELPVQIICRETALLFLSLLEAGPLPSYLLLPNEAANLREVQRLILDQVIQLEGPGGFVGGPAAVSLLAESDEEGESRLAKLSYEALRYAAALELADPPRIAAKLYAYNRLPANPDWNHRLGTPERAARFLGLEAGGRKSRVLTRLWRAAQPTPGWHHFLSSAQSGAPRPDAHKLYVSPHPLALPDVMDVAAEAFSRGGATQFKIGADITGLLRPDKLVAYFPSRDSLLRAADALAEKLSGVEAQGVPFTAQIDREGLVSWGSDPPARIAGARDSWRTWIVYRLALALVAAGQEQQGRIPPWRFAVIRIGLEGVDPRTFAPTGDWDEANRS